MANQDRMRKLAAEEANFLQRQFLSPVIRGQPIRVRIAGVEMTLNVEEPEGFEGWGVFEPTSYRSAKLVGEPSMRERMSYLQLFPRCAFVLCCRSDEQWYGVHANAGDNRFRFGGAAPVRFASGAQAFDTVSCRFDGANLWFERRAISNHPRNASFLREALSELRERAELHFSGLTPEERGAYARAWEREMLNQKDWEEDRIRQALHRAGAHYRSYAERGNQYIVDYMVDGQSHRSVVNKNDLRVQTAGICLDGGDRNFDLQSLVGVLREGSRTGQIYRMGTA